MKVVIVSLLYFWLNFAVLILGFSCGILIFMHNMSQYILLFPVVIKEIFEEDDKPQNGNAGRRRLKKNREISDSDDEDDVGSQRQLVVKGSSPKLLESEDEDGFPISFSMMQKSPVKKAEVNENPDQKSCVVKKRKIDTMADDTELKR